ncbi:MAG: YciI family protein [Candidatus Binataceae bacterium]
MQYMLLINVPEDFRPSSEDQRKMMDEYMAFTQDIINTGKFKAGNRLEPASTATTVKVRNGKTLTTDGPYAETKEQLGGYYLIEAANLDEAVTVAARIPGARHGSVEVRPVAQM